MKIGDSINEKLHFNTHTLKNGIQLEKLDIKIAVRLCVP